jgi:S-DNA-T family DNA segregation ATPase FtsK/SpoIIIE
MIVAQMCYNFSMPVSKQQKMAKTRTVKGKTPARKPAASSRSNAPARGRTSATRSVKPAQRAPAPMQNRPVLPAISPERKIDIIGIVVALLGLLTLLSLLSPTRGSLTGWWVGVIAGLFGWGAYVLPVALLLVGVWLVFRNFEKLPQLSLERLTGMVLIFLNLLIWMHLAGSWLLKEIPKGQGGGVIGGFFTQVMLKNLGAPAAVIVTLAWLVVGLVMTFDLSVVEIFHWLGVLWTRMVAAVRRYLADRKASRQSPTVDLDASREALQDDYTPFTGIPSAPEEQAVPTLTPGGMPVPMTYTMANTPAWVLPSLSSVLENGTPPVDSSDDDEQRAQIIVETLQSFGVPGHVVEIHRGPTITQFGVEPDFIETRNGRTRVRVSKIVALADDLALALAASRIRIQAPVPGRAYVGIEVPNSEVTRVTLREVLESEPFQKLKSTLRFTLGKDVAGMPYAADLTAMPHLLIAGTTGSGKSVCVNAILSCFLINNTPDQLRLILVDPKRVELTNYNGIPHLLAPVVTDAERVVAALQWMMREMDNRYRKFAEAGARNISDYNARLEARGQKRIPYLVVVIDELADLMMLAPDETERTITRLAQLARATGLHLIIATQRPSVDVLTGLIKANFPARIAFAVASGTDSRVILDQPGAERLLGRGDMLFQAPDAPAPVRLQGVYVSETEIQRLVTYWQAQAMVEEPAPGGSVDAVPSNVPLKQAPLWDDLVVPEDAGDPLYKEAVELVRREGRASISMLQRRMRIGYTRAARLIDTMEEKKIVGPPQATTQVREVLDYGQGAPPIDN